MGAAAHLATDHPGVLQRLDVLRGGRERNSEGFRKLAYRALAKGEFAKHPPARGVAEGAKDGIQLRCLWFNHVVEYKYVLSNSQPIS
jgi:hypothetical protein